MRKSICRWPNASVDEEANADLDRAEVLVEH